MAWPRYLFSCVMSLNSDRQQFRCACVFTNIGRSESVYQNGNQDMNRLRRTHETSCPPPSEPLPQKLIITWRISFQAKMFTQAKLLTSTNYNLPFPRLFEVGSINKHLGAGKNFGCFEKWKHFLVLSYSNFKSSLFTPEWQLLTSENSSQLSSLSGVAK